MATASNVDVTIVREVATASVTVTYTVNWSAFDRTTDLQYAENVRFVGVRSGRAAHTGPVGDDLLGIGLNFIVLISANGGVVTPRTRSLTFPLADLDEAFLAGHTDDEIRAIVTLTPWPPPAADMAGELVALAA